MLNEPVTNSDGHYNDYYCVECCQPRNHIDSEHDVCDMMVLAVHTKVWSNRNHMNGIITASKNMFVESYPWKVQFADGTVEWCRSKELRKPV